MCWPTTIELQEVDGQWSRGSFEHSGFISSVSNQIWRNFGFEGLRAQERVKDYNNRSGSSPYISSDPWIHFSELWGAVETQPAEISRIFFFFFLTEVNQFLVMFLEMLVEEKVIFHSRLSWKLNLTFSSLNCFSCAKAAPYWLVETLIPPEMRSFVDIT